MPPPYGPYSTTARQPWMNPGFYSPGQMAFTNNAEMSQLVTMFGGPLLGALAGPGNFMPHMMPTQALMDQYALRQYQNQTRQSAYAVSTLQNQAVATRLLAGRSALTNAPVSDLNREQAYTAASVINHPAAKMLMGMTIGVENTEAILHGSRGDMQALNSAVNRMGYYRPTMRGGGRMTGQEMADFTSGLFGHLYEPEGNIDLLRDQAEKNDNNGQAAIRRLQKITDNENRAVVRRQDVESRMRDLDAKKVQGLYDKYVQGGTETDTSAQIQALSRFDRAVEEAGVLRDKEITVGQMAADARYKPVREMHGFMGSQVGQIAEMLHQRGLTPQAIGSMSADERVRTMAATTIDEETKNKLAQDYLRRDLMNRNDADAIEFKNLKTPLLQAEYLEKNSSEARKTLDKTLAQVEKTARGDQGAMSAKDLESLEGFDILATNVDAKRTSGVVKEYAGAVAAVREIFGDNGNPNAPMPALLAALDQFTMGAMGSMSPKKVEATLRQMQTLAKETGVGMEQLAMLTANAGARGAQLGLAPQLAMASVPATLAAIQTMQNTGAFSGGGFGSLSRDQQIERVNDLYQRGDASIGAKSMAALARAYDADPGKYREDSEFVQAVKAYNDPESDGTYTFVNDKGEQVTRNIREVIGRGGIVAAQKIFADAGGDSSKFGSLVFDPRTGEYQQSGFGFLMQKYEAARFLSPAASAHVRNKLGRAQTDAEQKQQNDISYRLAEMVIDTANMSISDQRAALMENMEGEMIDLLGDTPEARRIAKSLSDQNTLDTVIGAMGTQHGLMTGGESLAALAQSHGNDRPELMARANLRSRRRAERRAKMAGHAESTPLAMIADYLTEIGESGEKFTAGGLVDFMTRRIGDSDMLQKYAKEMSGGFEAFEKLNRETRITNADITQLVEDNDVATLRKYAGYGNDITLVSNGELARRRKVDLAGMDDKQLAEAYKQFVPNSGNVDFSKLSPAEKASRISELRDNAAFTAAQDKRLLQDDERSYKQMEDLARVNAVNTIKEGQELRAQDVDKLSAALFQGEDADTLKAGIAATNRLFAVDDKTGNAVRDAILKGGENARANVLRAANMTEADFNRSQELYNKGQLDDKKTQKYLYAATALALEAAPSLELSRGGFQRLPDGQLVPTKDLTPEQQQALTLVQNVDAAVGGAKPAVHGRAASAEAAAQDAQTKTKTVNEQKSQQTNAGEGGGTVTASGGAPVEKNEPLQLTGTLTLDGLETVVANLTANRAQPTENGAAPVVTDRPEARGRPRRGPK